MQVPAKPMPGSQMLCPQYMGVNVDKIKNRKVKQ